MLRSESHNFQALSLVDVNACRLDLFSFKEIPEEDLYYSLTLQVLRFNTNSQWILLNREDCECPLTLGNRVTFCGKTKEKHYLQVFVLSKESWAQGIIYDSEYHYWFSLVFCSGGRGKGRGCFESLFFWMYFFLYSTLFLKLEDWSKPGLLLLTKEGISSIPLKGFWHSFSFVCFEISLSNSRDCSDSELHCYYQKATIFFSQKHQACYYEALGLQPQVFPINCQMKREDLLFISIFIKLCELIRNIFRGCYRHSFENGII